MNKFVPLLDKSNNIQLHLVRLILTIIMAKANKSKYFSSGIQFQSYANFATCFWHQ